MAKWDYYEILGVDSKASTDEIKQAYRTLARNNNFNFNRDNRTESDIAAADEKIGIISEAYGVLSDPKKRTAYDISGHAEPQGAAQAPAHGNPVMDLLFGTAARNATSRNSNERPKTVDDLIRDFNSSSRFGNDHAMIEAQLLQLMTKKPKLADRYLSEILPEKILRSNGLCNGLYGVRRDAFIEKMTPHYIDEHIDELGSAYPENVQTAHSWLLSFMNRKPELAVHYLKEISADRLVNSSFFKCYGKRVPML